MMLVIALLGMAYFAYRLMCSCGGAASTIERVLREELDR